MQFNPKSGEWLSMDSPMPIRASEPQKPVPQPEKKLAVVLPFIEKEIEQATKLLLKSFELCGQIPRNLFLVPFKGIKYDMVMAAGKQAFHSVGVIHDMEGKLSDWQKGERMRDASGPNTFFHQTAWFFYLNKKFPIFLWLEPDCMPVARDWFYQLENEYLSMNRPFMGAKMKMPDGREYMNGVGIYPWNLIQYEPLLVQSTRWKQFPDLEAAFDVAGGKKILDQAHVTRKIQLALTKENIELRPETVLVHGHLSVSEQRTPNGGQGKIEASPKEHKPDEPPIGRGDLQDAQDTLTAVPVLAESLSQAAERVCSEIRHTGGEARGSTGADRRVTQYEMPRGGGQKSNSAPSQTKQGEYGGVVKQIRKSVKDLVDLNISPSRKVLIVKELRRAKLVPKHFR